MLIIKLCGYILGIILTVVTSLLFINAGYDIYLDLKKSINQNKKQGE